MANVQIRAVGCNQITFLATRSAAIESNYELMSQTLVIAIHTSKGSSQGG